LEMSIFAGTMPTIEVAKWNFTKFLVARDGRVVKRYEPTEQLSIIEADIQQELKQQ